MNTRNKIKIASDNMLRNFLHFFATTALITLVLVACGVIAFLCYATNHLQKNISSAISSDPDAVGIVSLTWSDDDEYDAVTKYIKRVKEVDGIEAVAVTEYAAVECGNLSFLNDVQNGHKQFSSNSSDGVVATETVEVISLDSNSWDFFNFSLSQGEYDASAAPTENTSYIYLGCAYKNTLSVGDVISPSEDNDTTYIVSGFFKKGESILTPDLQNITNYDMYATLSLDYAVVIVQDDVPPINGIYFATKDSDAYGDAYTQLKYMAELMGVEANFYSVKRVISNVKKSLSAVNKYLLQITFVIGLTMVVVLSCIQTINIIKRQREYGALLANGVSKADITFMILFENAFKVIVGAFVSWPILYYGMLFVFAGDYAMTTYIGHAVTSFVMPCLALVAVVIAVISSALPLWYVKDMDIAEMIRE